MSHTPRRAQATPEPSPFGQGPLARHMSGFADRYPPATKLARWEVAEVVLRFRTRQRYAGSLSSAIQVTPYQRHRHIPAPQPRPTPPPADSTPNNTPAHPAPAEGNPANSNVAPLLLFWSGADQQRWSGLAVHTTTTLHRCGSLPARSTAAAEQRCCPQSLSEALSRLGQSRPDCPGWRGVWGFPKEGFSVLESFMRYTTKLLLYATSLLLEC